VRISAHIAGALWWAQQPHCLHRDEFLADRRRLRWRVSVAPLQWYGSLLQDRQISGERAEPANERVLTEEPCRIGRDDTQGFSQILKGQASIREKLFPGLRGHGREDEEGPRFQA
jgi:hypothetical protein